MSNLNGVLQDKTLHQHNYRSSVIMNLEGTNRYGVMYILFVEIVIFTRSRGSQNTTAIIYEGKFV